MTLITGLRIITVAVLLVVLVVHLALPMLVAVNTGKGRHASSRMAIKARPIMRTRQREERCVIKRRRRPSRGRVAFRTVV